MKTSPQAIIFFCILGLYLINASVLPQLFTQNQNNDTSHKYQTSNSAPASTTTKSGVDMTFSDFKKQFGKTYASAQEQSSKKANFDKNIALLKLADCDPCGVNQLFDLTDKEKIGLMGKVSGSKNPSINTPISAQTSLTAPALSATPTSYDWRNYNVVTSVKNQKNCGSCWAFAATAFLQSELIRRKKATKTIDLSEQFLLQCDKNSEWCDGGYIDTAINLGQKTGMPLESIYPYSTSSNYSTICTSPTIGYRFTLSNVISYWSPKTKYTDSQIISYLLQRPIALGVNANDFLNYAPTSTSRTLKCSSANSSSGYLINHAVLLVGYTSTEWIIKNSWGTSWGVNGYIYVSRSSSYNCAIGYQIETLDFKIV